MEESLRSRTKKSMQHPSLSILSEDSGAATSNAPSTHTPFLHPSSLSSSRCHCSIHPLSSSSSPSPSTSSHTIERCTDELWYTFLKGSGECDGEWKREKERPASTLVTITLPPFVPSFYLLSIDRSRPHPSSLHVLFLPLFLTLISLPPPLSLHLISQFPRSSSSLFSLFPFSTSN